MRVDWCGGWPLTFAVCCWSYDDRSVTSAEAASRSCGLRCRRGAVGRDGLGVLARPARRIANAAT